MKPIVSVLFLVLGVTLNLLSAWGLHSLASAALEQLISDGPIMVDKFSLRPHKTDGGTEWRGSSSRRFETVQSFDICLRPSAIGTPSPIADSGLVSWRTMTRGVEDAGFVDLPAEEWDGAGGGFFHPESDSASEQRLLGSIELPPRHTLVFMCSLPAYEGEAHTLETLHVEMHVHERHRLEELLVSSILADILLGAALAGTLICMVSLAKRSRMQTHSTDPASGSQP